ENNILTIPTVEGVIYQDTVGDLFPDGTWEVGVPYDFTIVAVPDVTRAYRYILEGITEWTFTSEEPGPEPVITTEEETKTISFPYSTEYQYNDDMYDYEENIIQDGVNGE